MENNYSTAFTFMALLCLHLHLWNKKSCTLTFTIYISLVLMYTVYNYLSLQNQSSIDNTYNGKLFCMLPLYGCCVSASVNCKFTEYYCELCFDSSCSASLEKDVQTCCYKWRWQRYLPYLLQCLLTTEVSCRMLLQTRVEKAELIQADLLRLAPAKSLNKHQISSSIDTAHNRWYSICFPNYRSTNDLLSPGLC